MREWEAFCCARGVQEKLHPPTADLSVCFVCWLYCGLRLSGAACELCWGIRIFTIASGITVSLEHFRVERGYTSSSGGILNSGTLTLVAMVLNRNQGGCGGGIKNEATGTVL